MEKRNQTVAVGRPQYECKCRMACDASINNRSCYPADLARILCRRWHESGYESSALPSEQALEELVDVAYQASLLREESDPVRCRILVAPPGNRELGNLEAANRLHLLSFDQAIFLTPHEVRKLAAAVGYYRSLIAVYVEPRDDKQVFIWGMAVTGASWVNRNERSVQDADTLPSCLVIHVLGPGHLIFACGMARVVETIGGQVLTEGFDPFGSKWLPEHFESVRTSLLDKLVTPAQTAQVRLCDSFVRDVAQNVVRRVLGLVRDRGHGGMLIYLTDEQDGRLQNWLRIRMRFKRDDATNRFQYLMLKLMQRALEIGASHGIAEVRWHDFLKMSDPSLVKLHDSLVEFSHFLADLMSVDGALVLNREFQLIGFGGEILGDSHVDSIERAVDLEAEQSITEPADGSGTRHRSAYRLVSGVPDAICVVVSQDGTVRFVAHRGGRLVYWPYLP